MSLSLEGTYSEPLAPTSVANTSALGQEEEEEEGERNEEINPTQDEMERERLMAKAEQVSERERGRRKTFVQFNHQK